MAFMEPPLTKLQAEIVMVLADEFQSAGQIEDARRAKGYKPMTTNGVRKSCENLAAKGLAERKFQGMPLFASRS